MKIAVNWVLTRSIFKKDNCRRLQSCEFFKYKNDRFQSSNFLLVLFFFIDFSQWWGETYKIAMKRLTHNVVRKHLTATVTDKNDK